MATNLKFHRITNSAVATTNFVRGDVYFVKATSGNSGKIYICSTSGTGSAAVLEDYSVDTNTWRSLGTGASDAAAGNHTHYYLSAPGDNRTIATKPDDYSNKLMFAGLKQGQVIDAPNGTNYNYVVGLRGWSDRSGGVSHELAFNNNGIYHRIESINSSNANTWLGWQKVVMNGDVDGYLTKITKSGNVLQITPKGSDTFSFTNTTYSRKGAEEGGTDLTLVNTDDVYRWDTACYLLEGVEGLLASI